MPAPKLDLPPFRATASGLLIPGNPVGGVMPGELDHFTRSLIRWGEEVEKWGTELFASTVNFTGNPAITINGLAGYMMTGLTTAKQVGFTGNVAVAPSWTTILSTTATLRVGQWVKIDTVLDAESIGATAGDFAVSDLTIQGVVGAAGAQVIVMQLPAATGRWGNMAQHYWYFAFANGLHTFTMRMQRSGAVGTIRSDDHTTLTLTVFTSH
jgi:hypothetical protein